MLGGQFMKVSGGTDQFKLSDLIVTGYSNDDGAWGELKLTVLNSYGMADTDDNGNKMNYYWFDNEESAAGWYDSDGLVKWDSENIIFEAGQAFWVQGEGLTVQGSGAVNFAPVTVETNAGGNTPIANPYPVAITLADISVSGYSTDDGAWGELKMTVLNSYGMADTDADGNKMNYYWFDNEETATGWYDSDGAVQWSESTSFPAGQGFWIQGEGLIVEFSNPAAPTPAE